MTPSLNAVYADWAARGVMPPGAERRMQQRRQGKEFRGRAISGAHTYIRGEAFGEERRKRDRRAPR